jgi:hypothetical protein
MVRSGWLVVASYVAFISICFGQKPIQSFSELSEFDVDSSERLRYQYFSFTGGEECSDLIKGLSFNMRQPVYVSGNASLLLFQHTSPHAACQYLCMERGTHIDHVTYPLQKQYFYTESSVDAIDNLADWYDRNCESQEIGFILYGARDATLYWIDQRNRRVDVGRLGRGERNTVWKQTYLGHQFQVVEDITNKVLGAYTVEYSGIYVLGNPDPTPQIDSKEIEPSIEESLFHEWDRSHQVKRSFTEFGFSKAKLPLDLFGSMSAYHYNNRNHMFLEEWETNDIFVNWWESKCFMILMPWELKVSLYFCCYEQCQTSYGLLFWFECGVPN